MTHDLARGQVEEFPVGSGASEICLAQRVSQTEAMDSSAPGAGQGYWYLGSGSQRLRHERVRAPSDPPCGETLSRGVASGPVARVSMARVPARLDRFSGSWSVHR